MKIANVCYRWCDLSIGIALAGLRTLATVGAFLFLLLSLLLTGCC